LSDGEIAGSRENYKEGSKQTTHELDDLFSTSLKSYRNYSPSCQQTRRNVINSLKVVGWRQPQNLSVLFSSSQCDKKAYTRAEEFV
jgi:hypothetical protein